MTLLMLNRDPEQLLDAITTAFREQPTPEFPDPAIEWPETLPSLPTSLPFGQFVATHRIQLAASLVFFALLGGYVSLPWGNEGARAFAQVRSAIGKAKSVVFRIYTFTGDVELASYKVTFVEPGLIRAEGENDVHIFNSKDARTMDVWHDKREAQIRPIYEALETRKRVMGAYYQLFELKASKPTAVTERTVDGRKVIEFQLSFDGSNAIVLVDAGTHFPMRMELFRGKNQSGETIREVVNEFVFNQPTSDDLFAIEPPNGYTVDIIEAQPQGASTESYLVSPENGMGPIRFGMTAQEVVALLGKPDKKESRQAMVEVFDGGVPSRKTMRLVPAEPKFTYDVLIYDSRGFRITVSSKDGVSGISCFDRFTMGPSSRKFLGKTSEGIAIGSDWNDVLQAYGEPSTKSTNEKKLALYSNPKMIFEFHDEKLRSMSVSAPHLGPK